MPTVLFTSALQRFLPVPSAQVTGATIAEALAAVFASEPRLRGYVASKTRLNAAPPNSVKPGS